MKNRPEEERMLDVLPALFFQGIIFLAAAFGIAALLYLPQASFDFIDFELLFRTEGTLPARHLRVLALCTMFLIMLLCGLFWFITYLITVDVKKRTPLVPLAPVSREETEPKPPLEKAIQYYSDPSPDLNFGNQTAFEGENGRQVTMLSKEAQDRNGLWSIQAVLVYENGESVRLNPAVLYGDEAWDFESWTQIKRRGFRSSVKIQTALKRHDVLRDLALRYDHIMTLGLTSRQIINAEDNYDTEFNYALAWARGQNLAIAVHSLKWKPVERIWPLHLGYPLDGSSEPEKQRPAVIVGVRASQEIVGSDVLVATSLLVKVQGVHLNRYVVPLTAIGKPEPINPTLGYRSPIGKKFRRGKAQPLLLPAEQSSSIKSKNKPNSD